MKKSYYFAELASSYDAEIQDLLNDSEGKSALRARLQEKREQLGALLPMIEFSPEMVVPVFYDAFSFTAPKAMHAAIACEPDDDDFPDWDRLSAAFKLADWAQAYCDEVLADGAGETFMVTAACLEFIRKFEHSAPAPSRTDDDEDKEDDGEQRREGRSGTSDGDDADDEDRDLAEAGDDWLGEQGFDSLKS